MAGVREGSEALGEVGMGLWLARDSSDVGSEYTLWPSQPARLERGGSVEWVAGARGQRFFVLRAASLPSEPLEPGHCREVVLVPKPAPPGERRGS